MSSINSDKCFLKEKYDFCFSLGAICFCSGALREAGRQFRSLPFDWVAGGTIVERAQMLLDGFVDWLKPELLQYEGEQNIELKRKFVYRNNKTGVHFIHDFLQSDEFTTSFKKVKAKYDRRIERLFQCVKNSNRVLAVYMSAPDVKEPVSDADLQEARDILSMVAPGVQIDLLYVYNKVDSPYERFERDTHMEGIYKAGFRFSKEELQVVDRKLVRAICKKIRLSWKHLTLCDILQRYHIFYIKKSEVKKYNIIKLFRIPVWRYSNR